MNIQNKQQTRDVNGISQNKQPWNLDEDLKTVSICGRELDHLDHVQ
jgi:hypothetical protein